MKYIAHRSGFSALPLLAALIACALYWCSVALAAEASSQRTVESPQWLTVGHDDAETNYSPLHQIDAGNVARLGYAWSYDLGTTKGLEGTPVVVDGIMYISAPWGIAHAVDARTGAPLWTFDPKVDVSVTRKVCCGIVSRGLAVSNGRVFVAALDGRLFSLDAKTGRILWMTDSIVDHERGYSVTSSPYVANGIVAIGNAGGEFDARGYVSAYNTQSGRLVWRFYTVPAGVHGPFENPELKTAARTWSEQSHWEVGLGGNVWGSMAYDASLDLLYVGTGNSPIYPRIVRSPGGGDNLFIASILAIHARTGRLAWHYQTVPGDQWDYDSTQTIILADLIIGGRLRQVLLQAPKDGFFYVIDRKSGELLSAEPYVPVNWASRVDRTTGRPIETGNGDFVDGPKLIFPGSPGGHNWQPMAFNRMTKLVYIPSIEAGTVYFMPKHAFSYSKGGINMNAEELWPAKNAGDWGLDSELGKGLPPLAEMARGQPDTTIRGFLRAWDPIAQRTVWQVETSDRWVGELNAMWNGGGVMTTAGNLVFQGRSTGLLYAYDARNGTVLAKINVGTSIMAAPMTYEINGEQFVAVAAGYGGALGGTQPAGTAAYRYGNAGRLIAFKLDGGAVPLPAEVTPAENFPRPAAPRFGTAEQIAHGMDIIKHHCSHCHVNQGPGAVPDLRQMSAQTFAEFDDIVLHGARAAKGMGNFSSLLTASDTYDIRAALMNEAWAAYEASRKPTGPQSPPHTPAQSDLTPP